MKGKQEKQKDNSSSHSWPYGIHGSFFFIHVASLSIPILFVICMSLQVGSLLILHQAVVEG